MRRWRLATCSRFCAFSQTISIGHALRFRVVTLNVNVRLRELNVVADTWKNLGARPEIHIIPPARANDREYQSTRPGFFISASSGVNYYENRLHSNQITSASNRWAGFNRGGYANPTVDSILDGLAGTIDPRDRILLHRQLIQEAMGSAAVLPLYWEVAPVVLLKGVKGHPFVHSHATWKFYLWDKE